MFLCNITAFALRRFPAGEQAGQAIFARQGFHLLRKHYYLPIPDPEDLTDTFYETETELVGVDMNEGEALRLLDNVFPSYLAEFRESLPIDRPVRPQGFYLLNGLFMAVDAHVYYALVRHFRPARVVEVGAGYSTLVALAALARNRDEHHPARLTAIDPYPPTFLWNTGSETLEVREQNLQEIGLELFTSLEPGDILFLDSTHVLRPGGDVQHAYCEVLPRLAPGVLVHVHDVSLPRSYPRTYFEDSQLYWNEQYVLQTFLAFNSQFEVLWPGNYMRLRHPDRVAATFPELATVRESFPAAEPTSFWFRVRA